LFRIERSILFYKLSKFCINYFEFFLIIKKSEAPTPAPHDFRNDYDRLLVELAQERTREGERHLLQLTHQIAEYEKSKDAALKARIISEIDTALPFMNGILGYLEREIKRTDLDLIERFIFESSRDDVQILIKQFTEVEKKIKATA
jgi:hypothetical protein